MRSKSCDCSVIIPTFNRRHVLEETLTRLDAFSGPSYETIVVDNGSTDGSLKLRARYPHVRWIELDRNLGAAARNVGAVAARGRVLLMLDDDSWPAEGTLERLVELFDTSPDLGAAACRVRLADQPHLHDAGGVPGIFFNCGGAIRREAFLQAGGFPVDFDYYVEEYDLCCRLWQNGWRVEPHGDTLVWHRRVTENRDNNRMLRLLVRNNLRLWGRYAPAGSLDDLVESTIDRYRRVAEKEGAISGFHEGLELGRAENALARRRRRPLSRGQFEDLFGLPAARRMLRHWADNQHVRTVAVWMRGKGCEQLLDILPSANIGVEAVYDVRVEDASWRGVPLRSSDSFRPDAVDGIVVGSLSPGVAEDIRNELRECFASVPIVSAAPWVRHAYEPLAASA
ncbi:MAG: glycosyltransferase family 2 protein [Planctomycetota bacterium]